jgi:hypothetical protein
MVLRNGTIAIGLPSPDFGCAAFEIQIRLPVSEGPKHGHATRHADPSIPSGTAPSSTSVAAKRFAGS